MSPRDAGLHGQRCGTFRGGAGGGRGCSCSESKGNEEVRGHSTGSLQTEHVQLPTVQAGLRRE